MAQPLPNACYLPNTALHDCMPYHNIYLYESYYVPSSANQCILGNVYPRSNISKKPLPSSLYLQTDLSKLCDRKRHLLSTTSPCWSCRQGGCAKKSLRFQGSTASSLKDTCCNACAWHLSMAMVYITAGKSTESASCSLKACKPLEQ